MSENQWMAQLEAEIERLRANQERMLCLACGTVTKSGACDCTRTGMDTQNLVNYADELLKEIKAMRADEQQALPKEG